MFSPPPPSRMPRADPLARGKSKDKLELSELATPLLDIVLKPGQVLYVPAGFPHTTGTVSTFVSMIRHVSNRSLQRGIFLDSQRQFVKVRTTKTKTLRCT